MLMESKNAQLARQYNILGIERSETKRVFKKKSIIQTIQSVCYSFKD